MHKETKDARKENAIRITAEKAQREFHDSLTMIAKYYEADSNPIEGLMLTEYFYDEAPELLKTLTQWR